MHFTALAPNINKSPRPNSVLSSFFSWSLRASGLRGGLELPSSERIVVRNACVWLSNEGSRLISFLPLLEEAERFLLGFSTVQFRGYNISADNNPFCVRYLSLRRRQTNNYHTCCNPTMYYNLQYRTTCRARCGFCPIGRFLRFFSHWHCINSLSCCPRSFG